MLGKFKIFLSWLSKQSIARVFSYTRQLERQINSQDKIYIDQIKIIKVENDEYINSLQKEISDLKIERQALLDRLLARNGYSPIWHKPEVPPVEKSKPEPYKPAYEAAIDEAVEEHKTFKSMLEAAKEWAKENRKAE